MKEIEISISNEDNIILWTERRQGTKEFNQNLNLKSFDDLIHKHSNLGNFWLILRVNPKTIKAVEVKGPNLTGIKCWFNIKKA